MAMQRGGRDRSFGYFYIYRCTNPATAKNMSLTSSTNCLTLWQVELRWYQTDPLNHYFDCAFHVPVAAAMLQQKRNSSASYSGKSASAPAGMAAAAAAAAVASLDMPPRSSSDLDDTRRYTSDNIYIQQEVVWYWRHMITKMWLNFWDCDRWRDRGLCLVAVETARLDSIRAYQADYLIPIDEPTAGISSPFTTSISDTVEL